MVGGYLDQARQLLAQPKAPDMGTGPRGAMPDLVDTEFERLRWFELPVGFLQP